MFHFPADRDDTLQTLTTLGARHTTLNLLQISRLSMPPTEPPLSGLMTVRSLVTTTQEPLPGKTWVVLADEEGGYNVTLPLGFGEII